jgi:hypothetical protein
MKSFEMGGYNNEVENNREALRDLISNPEKLDKFKNTDGTMKVGLKLALDGWRKTLTNSPEDNDLIGEVDALLNEVFQVELTETKKQENILDSGEYVKLAKQRAITILKNGELKQAIDSIISDLSKDPASSPEQVKALQTMGMILRNDPTLDSEKVKDFINGFAE